MYQYPFKENLFLGVFVALFCFNIQHANAQNSASETVGNPSSANTIIVDQVYGIAEQPTPTTTNNAQPNDMEPLPDSPGVEVAPPPTQTPQNNNMPSETNDMPTIEETEINEEITEYE